MAPPRATFLLLIGALSGTTSSRPAWLGRSSLSSPSSSTLLRQGGRSHYGLLKGRSCSGIQPKAVPPTVDVYVLGLETTLAVDHDPRSDGNERVTTPPPPRISGALRRCRSPFYIVASSDKELASSEISRRWDFLSSEFGPESRRLFGGNGSPTSKLEALKEISKRIPSNSRVHYIDGDSDTVRQVLEDESPQMQKWRVYWSTWGDNTTVDSNFLQKYDGTRAVLMDLDDFVELVGTGVIMGYPYTHKNEEYQR